MRHTERAISKSLVHANGATGDATTRSGNHGRILCVPRVVTLISRRPGSSQMQVRMEGFPTCWAEPAPKNGRKLR